MSILVVDTSALGALVFGEPKAEKVAELLSEGTIIAPSLVWFELASVCLKKIKAHPEKKRLILEAFNNANRLKIEKVEVDHSAVIDLALDKGITTYDASYLWLAWKLKADLVTIDEKLQITYSKH
ncbi:type II toxin-antitoxin system VapC family toxin [Desulfobacterota bacterium AH_259_B03_O07]|nr:type II toxin-antitoxin system VapC family toxin [Desulfobacterota bacterium AH_259_B03_O07]